MKLKFRHRTDCEKIILTILLIIFTEGTLGIFIPKVHPLYYLVDVLNIFLLMVIFTRGKISRLYSTPLKGFIACFTLFALISVMGVITNFSNLALHLWGARSIFSNFIFFIACVLFEKSSSLDFIEKIFWINLAVSIIEILMGYRQDWFGGIYGIVQGNVNGSLNLLLIIIMTKSIVEYLNHRIDLYGVFFKGLTSLVIASFAELKIFYVEICLIVVLCSLVTRFSYKKLAIIVLSVVGIIFGIRALFIIFPDIDSNMFSLSYMWNYLTNPGGYVGQFAHNAGDINRLAFWDKCIRLLNGVIECLFGLGIGNCDKIELLGLASPFYQRYGALHYYMFPLPMILLQQGIIGMLLYILLFVTLFIAVKIKKDQMLEDNKDVTLCQIVEVLCLISFIITIYDTSLLGKGGFLFFYVLAMPFVNTFYHDKEKI